MGDLVLPNPAYSFAAHASMLTHCMVECQAESNFFRHLEIMPVIPSLRSRASSERSEGSLRQARQILRCAQDDSQDPSQVRSREAFSPNVYGDESVNSSETAIEKENKVASPSFIPGGAPAAHDVFVLN